MAGAVEAADEAGRAARAGMAVEVLEAEVVVVVEVGKCAGDGVGAGVGAGRRGVSTGIAGVERTGRRRRSTGVRSGRMTGVM